jgi:hypothetical protein
MAVTAGPSARGAVRKVWYLWFLAAACELAAVVASFLDTGRMNWAFAGPIPFCIAMGLASRKGGQKHDA